MQNIDSYFETYPGSNKVFETSDGLLFHQDGDAALHANSLKDKGITLHQRTFKKEAADEGDKIPVITGIVGHEVESPEGGTAEGTPFSEIQIPVDDKVTVDGSVELETAKTEKVAIPSTMDKTDVITVDKQDVGAATTETAVKQAKAAKAVADAGKGKKGGK